MFMVYWTKASLSKTIYYAYSMEFKGEWISGRMWDETAMKNFTLVVNPWNAASMFFQNVGSRYPSDGRHTAEEWNSLSHLCGNLQALDLLAGF